jgi:hypothetical protein
MEKRLGKLEVLWRSSADEAVHAATWANEGHLRYGDLGADQRTIAQMANVRGHAEAIRAEHGLAAQGGDTTLEVHVPLELDGEVIDERIVEVSIGGLVGTQRKGGRRRGRTV